MKKLLLVCLLLISSVANAQVVEQSAMNNNGQPFLRLVNQSSAWVACFYSDSYNYLTFSIAPNTVTNWIPVYGAYIWQCNYY